MIFLVLATLVMQPRVSGDIAAPGISFGATGLSPHSGEYEKHSTVSLTAPVRLGSNSLISLRFETRYTSYGDSIPVDDSRELVVGGTLMSRLGYAGIGAGFLIGYTSDDELIPALNLMSNLPAGSSGDSWRFTLFCGEREESFRVIPGAAYSWSVRPSLQLNIGIPTSLSWIATHSLEVAGSWNPMAGYGAALSYSSNDCLKLNGEYRSVSRSEGYSSSGTEDCFELSAGLGVSDIVSVNLAAGYAWNREYSSSEEDETILVGPGPYLSTGLTLIPFGSGQPGEGTSSFR